MDLEVKSMLHYLTPSSDINVIYLIDMQGEETVVNEKTS